MIIKKHLLTNKQTKNKQNRPYLYIGACAGAGSVILGGFSILKCKKNMRNKYAVYLKNAISEFLTTPQGKPYLDDIERDKIYVKNTNFITHYKAIKNNVKQLTEYCQKHSDVIEEKTALINLKEKLINMKTIFINIKGNFYNEYINKSIKYCLKNVAIGGVLGTMAGFCSKILKGSISENK